MNEEKLSTRPHQLILKRSRGTYMDSYSICLQVRNFLVKYAREGEGVLFVVNICCNVLDSESNIRNIFRAN